MNAYELADLIGLCGDGGYNQDAATMLRQQQAEIEALRRHREWIEETAVKELTDEEIISEWIGNGKNYYNFARAILRKAQE